MLTVCTLERDKGRGVQKERAKWLVVKQFSGRERIQPDAAPPTASDSLQSEATLGFGADT